MKILVLGVTGMLGHVLYKYFSNKNDVCVTGIFRDKHKYSFLSHLNLEMAFHECNIFDENNLIKIIDKVKPDVIINCIGVIKQVKISNNPLKILPINSLFPHKLNAISSQRNIRLIHFSTDCVFDGKKGNYVEEDNANALDLYGVSKKLGEVSGENVLTIRTSIIGHEIKSKNGLLEWFLSQNKEIQGYKNAFFSGLPTVEIAEILDNHILKNKKIKGIMHISGPKISKFELLIKMSELYNKKINIVPNYNVKIDRSLNSTKFKLISNYTAPNWVELINKMKTFHEYKL